MQAECRMTERECIAYRLGFDDGLAAMREKIKDLLLENRRLREPILGPAYEPPPSRDHMEHLICAAFRSGSDRHPPGFANGRG